ncbi:MAG: CCDC90 family protein [Acidobacteriaceae bacterium]|nr:CCDC90 family protein [Acidobacteriaceae bacterium]
MAFDTLLIVQRLREKGFEREKAEALVEAMRDTQLDLFTKADGEQLRKDGKADVEQLRSDIKADMNQLRSDIKADMYQLEVAIAKVSTRVNMLLWLLSVLGIGGIIMRAFHLI